MLMGCRTERQPARFRQAHDELGHVGVHARFNFPEVIDASPQQAELNTAGKVPAT
jgi:hypothetical protein